MKPFFLPFKLWLDRLKQQREKTMLTLSGIDLTLGLFERIARLFLFSFFLGLSLTFILIYAVPVLVYPQQLVGVMAVQIRNTCQPALPCDFDAAYGIYSISLLLMIELAAFAIFVIRYGLKIFSSVEEPEPVEEAIERMSFELVEIRARLGEG